MSDIEFLDINDPRTKRVDRIYALVDLRKGQIKELPCGPLNGSHLSGSRPLKWDELQGEAVIPREFRGQFVFYEQFCSDPGVNASVGLDVKKGAEYFETFEEFTAMRGHGSGAKMVAKLDTERLLHPALLPLRERAKSSRGQVVVDEAALEKLLGRLGPSPAPSPELPQAPVQDPAVPAEIVALLQTPEGVELLRELAVKRMSGAEPGASAGSSSTPPASPVEAGVSATTQVSPVEAGASAGKPTPSSTKAAKRGRGS